MMGRLGSWIRIRRRDSTGAAGCKFTFCVVILIQEYVGCNMLGFMPDRDDKYKQMSIKFCLGGSLDRNDFSCWRHNDRPLVAIDPLEPLKQHRSSARCHFFHYAKKRRTHICFNIDLPNRGITSHIHALAATGIDSAHESYWCKLVPEICQVIIIKELGWVVVLPNIVQNGTICLGEKLVVMQQSFRDEQRFANKRNC